MDEVRIPSGQNGRLYARVDNGRVIAWTVEPPENESDWPNGRPWITTRGLERVQARYDAMVGVAP